MCSKTCKEQNDSYFLTAEMLRHLFCPGIQIYTNGWFKSKTARGNRYSYMGFSLINSVLNILSLISGGRCSYRKRPVKYLAKLTSTVSKTKKKFVFKQQHFLKKGHSINPGFAKTKLLLCLKLTEITFL